MVPLSMTLSDLWPGFQGHDIFWSRISWKVMLWKTKLLLHNKKLYLIYGMVLCLIVDLRLTAKRVAPVVTISWDSCSLKIWHLVATILIIFLRINWQISCILWLQNIPTSQGHYKLQDAWFKVTPIDSKVTLNHAFNAHFFCCLCCR